uniref:Uncharacterized protein n=1 Tax=Arundo donax TaxID=35708 RepID=A0A0A8YAY8_ARUDO
MVFDTKFVNTSTGTSCKDN